MSLVPAAAAEGIAPRHHPVMLKHGTGSYVAAHTGYAPDPRNVQGFRRSTPTTPVVRPGTFGSRTRVQTVRGHVRGVNPMRRGMRAQVQHERDRFDALGPAGSRFLAAEVAPPRAGGGGRLSMASSPAARLLEFSAAVTAGKAPPPARAPLPVGAPGPNTDRATIAASVAMLPGTPGAGLPSSPGTAQHALSTSAALYPVEVDFYEPDTPGTVSPPLPAPAPGGHTSPAIRPGHPSSGRPGATPARPVAPKGTGNAKKGERPKTRGRVAAAILVGLGAVALIGAKR